MLVAVIFLVALLTLSLSVALPKISKQIQRDRAPQRLGQIGGGRVTTGYAANGRITDVGTGRLVWAARATTAPSPDVNAQLAELSKAVFDSADKSGLF